MKSARKICILLLFLPSMQAFCQGHSDCQTAQKVCDKSEIEVVSAVGEGDFEDLSSTCLMQEFATTWFSWKIQQPGTLTFTLTASNGMDDLDFAIFKLNAPGDCDNKTLVRCMAAGESVGEPLPQPVSPVNNERKRMIAA